MNRSHSSNRLSRRPQFDKLETREVLSTYVVSPFGNDANPGTATQPFRTLQQAANTATAGDVVNVKPGNYAGFELGYNGPGYPDNKTGLPGKPIVYSAEPGAVISSHNNKTLDGIDLEYASYITIQGFKITSSLRAGIRAVQGTNITLLNNNSMNNTTWGIYTSFSDNLVVSGNTCSGSLKQHGIYVANTCVNPVVTNNTVFGNSNCGIQFNGDVSQGGLGIITGAVVTGNYIYNNGASGGAAINCDGLQNSLIANNTIINNLSTGIALFQGDSSAAAKNNTVANNTIVVASTGRYAININNGATGNKLYNNILFDQNTSRGAITITSDSLSGFKSDYNIGSAGFQIDGGANLTLASWRTATGQDAHSSGAILSQVFVDPTLASGVAILTTGPAYVTGINLSQYFTTNGKGQARQTTGKWNIGAM